jgi:ADP-ribose pyrophosphatase YjhB (NUDIX family)
MSEAFRFCPRCATRLEEVLEGDRPRMKCPACGFVHYRNPASAAGVVVVEDGSVLLVKRRHDPYRGLWVIPSGFVELDEDVRATAVRETREETGLDVSLAGLLDVESCFDDPRGNALLVLYLGGRTGGTLTPGDDAEEARFFPLESLPPIAFEAHRKALGKLAANASKRL